MKKLFAISVLILSLAACSTQKFELDTTSHTSIPTYEGTSHFVFWGIGQEKQLYPAEVCGARGISSVETHDSFLNGLFSVITWGIYSPRDYAVYCKN